MCQNSLPSGGGIGHLEPRFLGELVVPLPIYWYHSKGNWLRYNTAAESFYTMKLCCRLLVLYCRNCPKDAKFRYVIAILRKLGAAWTLVDGSLESSCRVLVKSNWTSFSISYTVEALYKAKCVKTRWLQEGVGHLEPRFQGEGVVPEKNFWFLQN